MTTSSGRLLRRSHCRDFRSPFPVLLASCCRGCFARTGTPLCVSSGVPSAGMPASSGSAPDSASSALERCRQVGREISVMLYPSGYGLPSASDGHAGDLSQPGSTSDRATALDVMALPRSLWTSIWLGGNSPADTSCPDERESKQSGFTWCKCPSRFVKAGDIRGFAARTANPL